MPRQLIAIAGIGAVVVVGLLADDWIASVALLVLFLGWRYLLREKGPPIVAAAFSNQWLQVTVGILYFAFTGRRVIEMQTDEYRPMVLIGLATIITLFAGFYLAAGLGRARKASVGPARQLPWSTYRIGVCYGITVAIAGLLQEIAWSTSGLTQVILVLSRIRYVFLFLLVTRLAKPQPRWQLLIAILAAEIILGFTGFFADFREPLVIIGVAIFGTMDRKKAATWVTIASIAGLAIGSALIWTSVKPIIREQYLASVSAGQRLNSVVTLTSSTLSSGIERWKGETDHLISRIWVVYFAGLAYKRVPSIVPYENGAILREAVDNVLKPRLFFPNKPEIASQSDEVRKYAGVWVLGRETNTSFAFGYAGESYVDFGLPYMFVPIFILGAILGFGYRWLSAHISYDELRIGVIIVIFWSTLGLYEASWVMIIGPGLTVFGILGGGAVLLDRFLRKSTRRRMAPSRGTRAALARS
ncbi:MAG: hypothetical protein ABR582_03290 [Gemmatimonadaceae bacterium]